MRPGPLSTLLRVAAICALSFAFDSRSAFATHFSDGSSSREQVLTHTDPAADEFIVTFGGSGTFSVGFPTGDNPSSPDEVIVLSTDPLAISGVTSLNYAIGFMADTLAASSCLVVEPPKPTQSGGTIALKIRFCTGPATRRDVALVPLGLSRVGTSELSRVDASGYSNPGEMLRTGAGYHFNLQTTGLEPGAYIFNYTVVGSGHVRLVPFTVR